MAEDLRSQILGQLSSCLSYDRLYQDALNDPSLKRTRHELEVAMTNANLARKVVFELFQDLDRFNLGDYQKFDDKGRGMQRLVNFVSRAARLAGQEFKNKNESLCMLFQDGQEPVYFTTDRDRALQEKNLELMGLEHPIVQKLLHYYIELDDSKRAVIGTIEGVPERGLLTIWRVNTQTKDNQMTNHIVRIAITINGDRAPWLERLYNKILGLKRSGFLNDNNFWRDFASQQRQKIQDFLHRELLYSGIINEEVSYSATLIGVIGIDK